MFESTIRTKLFILLVALACMLQVNSFGIPRLRKLSKLPHTIAASITATIIATVGPVMAEEATFQDQLRAIQTVRISQQKATTEKSEQELASRVLLYPENRLIARGTVKLQESSTNPFGLLKASDLDGTYDGDKASLFILAVGREGPPLAAVQLKVKDVEFPIVFEVTTDDLVFPYTKEAWEESSNSKDTIAVTAIISANDKLSQPTYTERFGFAVSDPLTFAGKLTRSPADLKVNEVVARNLYTPQELELLKNVDVGLEKIESAGKSRRVSKAQLEQTATASAAATTSSTQPSTRR